MDAKLKENRWDKEFEKEIYEGWKNNHAFTEGKKVFSIDTPPPYVNAPIHIGHATVYTIMDMIARYKRMKGFSVLFPLGLDRNGLPIEMAAEKRFGISIHDTEREKFVEYCKKILEETSTESIDSFLKLGISFNSWKAGNKIGDVYLTDSEEYRTLTQDTFIDLWNKGLVYEDDRVNNYCPGCRTTIADAEIDYKEAPTLFNDVYFTVKETNEKIIIGTTRPELICSCSMVVFNPEDERYKHLEGKTAVTPLFSKEVPIIAHPSADKEKGTGLMMMCSFGDQTDIRFFREQNIKPIISINQDGTMNEKAGFLKGLAVKAARKKIIEELQSSGLLVKQQTITHRTPICERSKHEIEFISQKEYYLKQVDFREKMLEFAEKLNFFDDRSRQILIDWINTISTDWPLTRRRYYATEVPLWHCKCGKDIVPEKGSYHQPWKEKRKCSCGGEAAGDERVFDTWFDSSTSPLYIMKWGKGKFFSKNFPCTLRPQGKEIVRNWLYYTLLKCYHLTGEKIFRDVWIHYHVTDDKGYKMSKSKGNVIDPHEIIEKHGAEPFRLWVATEGNIAKTDLRCSFERIEGASKTLTKLWNVARFISMFHEKKCEHLKELDKWIINELNDLIRLAESCYEKYDFHTPAVAAKHFLWETFASHYLELVKPRAYDGDESALHTLNYCLDNLLKILAPITPFITHKIFMNLRGEQIHEEKFPATAPQEEVTFKTEELVQLNSAIWKAKKDVGLSLKAEIKELTMPEKFRSIEGDLLRAHSIKKIGYGEMEIKL
ncbi:MAG TPA: valine--tRNA ligase [archaeon]|nr:valine--tRNA ligase [archaeon]